MKLNLPVILLNGIVLLPENEIKLEFEDEISKNLIEEAELFHDKKLLIVAKLDLEENIIIKNLPKVGTVAKITRKLELPNGKVRVVLKGLNRAYVVSYLKPNKETFESIISIVRPLQINSDVRNGLIKKLNLELENYIKRVPYMSNSLLSLISDSSDLSNITDIIVNHMPLETDQRTKYLNEFNPIKRVELILEDIYKQERLYNIEKNIDTKVKKDLDKEQKDFYIREKIKQLQNELGNVLTKEKEVMELKNRVSKLSCNENIKTRLYNEIDKYDSLSSMSIEIGQVKNYIDWLINLPWGIYDNDNYNFDEIRKSLDQSHYGMEVVKNRIIEYLASKKHYDSVKSPIICLVGPPGVGKTTFARSIAKSLGRKFVKLSVGGIDDEAIIRGNIRSYLGAAPGKIIFEMRKAKTSNPVFLIDEIDKMKNNYKGDPESALLEVLDTNQNMYFKDNFIEEEFDLSKVFFITTANDVNNISKVLRDRLEIINIEGYTELEKVTIAKEHLIPSICLSHNIGNLKISDENLLNIIRYYTKESGIRELEQIITIIVRKIISKKVIENKKLSLTINNVEKYLGKRRYEEDIIRSEIGVVNGLAYTENGGDIIPVEVNYYKGSGKIILTGSLGNIAKESAKVALGYIKSSYFKYNIDYNLFENDIHVNLPNVSIKKEGPSAGLTIAMAIVSSLTNLKIDSETAFTGEISLRGNILKIGSLKEKLIGAYLNKIKLVFIPFLNINELDDIPIEIKNKIKIIPVRNFEEVYTYLINKGEKNG